jgi:hypothetical protein
MNGRLWLSTKTPQSVISTTHHAAHDVYLTRVFGGPLNPRGHEEWTQANDTAGAEANHRRFVRWALKIEARK